MTEDQLNKEAEEYALKQYPGWPLEMAVVFISKKDYIAGYRSRDKEVEEKDKEIERLKGELKQHLPYDCVAGHDEVKFCHIRQGDGWRCRQCAY